MFAFFNYPGLAQTSEPCRLELIERRPRQAADSRPLLFIHGAYAGAWCWDEYFLPYFAERGYHALALSLRGHGGSEGGERLHSFGIADYVSDLAQVVAGLEQPPVLIGHSMGGMVVQKYLERHQAPAAVLMASVPPSGLGGSAMRLMSSDPMLMLDMSLLQHGRVSPQELRSASRAVFSDDVRAEDLARYARNFQAESHRALWDMTVADLPKLWRINAPPMLVLGAADDALFSTAMVEATAQSYAAELEIFPGMAHGMMLERDWQLAADRIVTWLNSP